MSHATQWALWISAVDKWKDAVISEPSPFKGISETTKAGIARNLQWAPFLYGLLLNLFGKVNRVVKHPFTTSSHNE